MVDAVAKELASIGRKILVVDAYPSLRRKETSYATPGFVGLLNGEGLHVLKRSGYDYLEFGNIGPGGLSITGWDGILRVATSDYDMVLLCSGTILLSPEAEHMATASDLVVLVVEAEKQTRAEVRRAGDILAAIQPASVGSVLINVKVLTGHGYYAELARTQKALPPGPA